MPTGRRSLRPLVLLALLLALAAAGPPTLAIPGDEWLLDQVKILSAPSMEGRASGTPGGDRAAEYVSRVFKAAGLRPGGDGGGFLQTFPVPTGIRLGPNNALAVLSPRSRALALGSEFTPLSFSSDGSETAPLVFVGYGITAPPLGYDDYQSIDAKGKVVLALTGEPRSEDSANPFRRPEAYHYGGRSHKLINAREHGARGILLVAHPGSESDRLPTLRTTSPSLGILAAMITRAVADSLLATESKSLADITGEIDRTFTARSFPLRTVTVRLEANVIRERGIAANVIGVVPGTDPALKGTAIVIGAHYDHLGRGGEGSLAPDQDGAIHPGADDNASGTAAVMALATAFAATGGVSRTLVFVAFAGEELGLLGSAHYVEHPALPLDRTILMLNLDMIGRLRDRRLWVAGVDTGTGLRARATEAAAGLALQPELRGDPFAPSDHTAFYHAGRPVVFLFTGAHGDYHRPTDTWDKLNGEGLATVTAFAARFIDAVARDRVVPAYGKIDTPPIRGGGYGAFFGVVPDFGEIDRAGVKISGVRPGSPADRAGVHAGDLIVEFGGVAVATLEDLTFALRRRRAGDRVSVVIVREGQARTVSAVLEERR